MVFNTYFKLGNLTPSQREKKGCQNTHSENSGLRKKGVVHEINLACGFKNMGKTSRCFNDRQDERKMNVTNERR